MSFETIIIPTLKECISIRDKYGLEKIPFNAYRYDRENNVYIFITFGIDYDHPGRFFLIWNDEICYMAAHPTERCNILNDNPEKSFEIQSIHIPEKINNYKEMIIKLLEEAFIDYELDFNEKHYIFKIKINKDRLLEQVYDI